MRGNRNREEQNSMKESNGDDRKENRPIMITRSSVPGIEQFVEEIRPVFENHILTNMGPVYKKLQRRLKEYLQVPELSLFVNGHMALELAIEATGLKHAGGEVITTPFTFVSTTHAIVRNQLTPVFCDIRPDDYTMDAKKIEELITEKTVAIIPVHVYGNVCDIESIQKIAGRHHLKVIYDAAHAFGVKYKGAGIGSFGDASVFSFHATKVFNTIEGGAVAFRNTAYKDLLHELKNFGICEDGDVAAVGANAKMNEFAAAMGICNLRRMEECLAKRKAVHDRYFERLSGVKGLRLCAPQESVTPNYAYLPVYVDPEVFGKSRDDVFRQLEKHDIHARKYFYPAVNDMACYRCFKNQPTPVAHRTAANILTLPIYEELPAEDVDRICDLVLGQ